MKKTSFLLLTVLSLIVSAEPYRPYPVITVHGYNANNYNGSNFETVEIQNCLFF